jgi:hypothetical protein
MWTRVTSQSAISSCSYNVLHDSPAAVQQHCCWHQQLLGGALCMIGQR